MSRIFSSSVALGWLVLTPVAFAGSNPAFIGPTVSRLALGQVGAPSQASELSKRKVIELLNDARRAMAEQNWETADSLVSRAEAMNVKFGLFHIGDTPQKVRRELQLKRPSTQQTTTMKPSSPTDLPSQRFTPSAPSELSQEQGPSSAIVDPNRRVDQFQAVPPEDSRPPVTMQDPKSQAKVFLSKGRKELSQGNLIGAAHWYQKSAEQPAQFNPGEDSPDRLLEDIRKAGGKVAKPTSMLPSEQEFAQAPGNPFPPDTNPFGRPSMTAPPTGRELGLHPQAETPLAPADDAATRAASDKMLWTARRALAVGDARQASEMVQKARALRVRYDFHEDSCDKVEAAIQRFATLTQQPNQSKESEKFRRQFSELLMQQAEALMNWGDFDEAERLTNDAKRLPVNYGPFDAQPDTMLQRIAAARKQPQGQQVEPLPPVTAGSVETAPSGRDRHLQLVAQARQALAAGDLKQAENLARTAETLQVPDTEFGQQDDRAWWVLLDIQKMQQQRQNVAQAGGNMPMGPANGAYPGSQAIYDPRNDGTRNIPVSASAPEGTNLAPPREFGQTPGGPGMVAGPGGLTPSAEPIPGGLQAAPSSEPVDANMPRGVQLLTQGEAALRKGDRATATALFREAFQHREQLDPGAQQRLQNYLQTLPPPTNPGNTAGKRPNGAPSMLDQATGQHQVLVRKVSAELAHQESLAAKMRENDPKGALAVLEKARIAVDKSGLDTASRDVLLRRVDRSIMDMERYIAQNKSQIDLKERNTNTKEQLERERKNKVEVQEKLALLVNEFNQLMEEKRFPEAEIVAKKAQELAPDELVVLQLKRQSQFARREYNLNSIRERKEDNYVRAITDIEESMIPFPDNNPYVMPDAKKWNDLTVKRKPFEGGYRRSERELEIEKKLKTPVSLKFHETPLDQVMNHLARLGGLNLHLDQRGLSEQGVTLSTPVTIDLSQDIMLKSALNLILEPLHLSYVIKDEVLKITSEELRDGVVFPKTYNVADLVIPIPNFVPNSRMGLAGALHDAQNGLNSLGGGGGGVGGVSPVAAVASLDGSKTNAVLDPRLMAQFNQATGGGQSMSGGFNPATSVGQPAGFGPGGLGGGVQPDFDSLIELITSTIRPDTWSDTGGPGAIEKFPTNLSLVITQTQEVHEQIADLLAQLRRLQDLQVTIEVRFLRLDDNFYERIGVDFQFDINTFPDHQFQIFGNRVQQPITPGAAPPPTLRDLNHKALHPSQSMTVGLAGPNGQFSSDLDIPFSNSSFGLALPNAFSGFPGAGVADGGINFGFALLSDLEATLFIDAAQGSNRTNLLQAPKVTLFNGQQAFVSDTSQSPFVISVVPVVGDFAAAQMPVIVVLNEGTFLSVQAVISNDRRFVRLTIVPFFSNIGEVNTFQFTGSTTTTNNTSSDGPANAIIKRSQDTTVSNEGTTVQLPTFAFFTVTTTVSVPDGGTVLLGGIKRLSENRAEFGVPILSKVPYINRLFRNVGIGRQTQSLMMMVTPRIIIQEEEELNNQGALTVGS